MQKRHKNFINKSMRLICALLVSSTILTACAKEEPAEVDEVIEEEPIEDDTVTNVDVQEVYIMATQDQIKDIEFEPGGQLMTSNYNNSLELGVGSFVMAYDDTDVGVSPTTDSDGTIYTVYLKNKELLDNDIYDIATTFTAYSKEITGLNNDMNEQEILQYFEDAHTYREDLTFKVIDQEFYYTGNYMVVNTYATMEAYSGPGIAMYIDFIDMDTADAKYLHTAMFSLYYSTVYGPVYTTKKEYYTVMNSISRYMIQRASTNRKVSFKIPPYAETMEKIKEYYMSIQ